MGQIGWLRRALCFALPILSLVCAAHVYGTEREIDTGKIKIVVGKTSGGVIDEVYLDRNGDGVYSVDELIVRQPPNEPGVVVSYIHSKNGQSDEGVSTGMLVRGMSSVEQIEVQEQEACVKGHLTFDGYGSVPFEVGIRALKTSAKILVRFAFAPLKNASGLLLKEASLRIYGVFDERDPGTSRRSMSTGDFRATPRPKLTYQPLVWQLGGELIESPWYWRTWVSWSESTGPVTTREGSVPPRELAFFMRDDTHGIQAAVAEPALAAPFELSGVGYPSNLGVFAWSPRVRPLPMSKSMPEWLELKNVAINFFSMGLGPKAGSGVQYRKKVDAIIAASREDLFRNLTPIYSSIRDPRLDDEMLDKRKQQLLALPVRGWDAQVQGTPIPPAMRTSEVKQDFAAGSLSIDLDGPAIATKLPLPARGGIPFPCGALKSSENLRLVDEKGREIPIQADRLAIWPDGSVKWVLVTLLAGEDERRGKLSLQYGPNVRRQTVSKGKLSIVRNGDGLQVDTGSLRFAIDRKTAGLFANLWFDPGNNKTTTGLLFPNATAGERANRMDLLALASSKDYAPYAFHAEGAKPELSRAEVESVEIEREGLLVSHIVVKGRYRYAMLGRGRDTSYKNEGCEFWIRYTVYAGQPYVEVKHTFVFEGNPDLEMIRELSLSMPFTQEDSAKVSIGLDGKTYGPYTTKSAGIYQDNPHAAEIWTRDEGGEHVRAVAAIADGWIDVRDSQRRVIFGLRDMREMYAKELSINEGKLTVSLWPKRARLLDTRRYARQYGSGESASFGQGMAEGVSRSHDMFFFFHDVDDESPAGVAVAKGLQRPILVKASPAWYAGSKAIGEFRARDSSAYDQWERLISDGIDYFLYHRQLWAWLGIYDYGDMQQVPDGRGGWERLVGRWGWVNNEALIDMLLYEQFFRTGQREYFDAALAMTRHVQEVDLINSNNYKGNQKVKMQGHRHNVNHWGDGYVGVRVAAPNGFRLGYYLTGDQRIYDQLRMGMDAHWESIHAYDREHSAGLGYLIFFWETTGDPVYRDALTAYIDFQVGHFLKFGAIHNGVWNFRKDLKRAIPEKPLSEAPTIYFFQNFGSAYSLMDLADLMGRRDLIQTLVQFARDTMQQRGGWEARLCHYRLVAFAYRHTGDPVFLKYATEKAGKLRISSDRKSWSQRSAIELFENKLSMFAWAAQGLPYLMRAVDMRAMDPEVSFVLSKVARMPQGSSEAPIIVDSDGTRSREGGPVHVEWHVNGNIASREMKDTLLLPAGKHRVSLIATDDQGRVAEATKTITVWEPGVVAQLCFRGNVDGFVDGEYNEEKGYGYTHGSRLVESSEPQSYGGKGCREVLISGGVRVKTGQGRFTIVMGGADFYTESMGKMVIQGRSIEFPIVKEAPRKLRWSYTGEAVVGPDGVLSIDFEPGLKGERVVLAYIIVRVAS